MEDQKLRHSSTRGKKRRTNWKIKTMGYGPFAHSGQPRLPHRICANCGHYGGEEVLVPQNA